MSGSRDTRPAVGFFLVPDYMPLLLAIIRELNADGWRCIVFCGTQATRNLLESGPYRDDIADIVMFTPPTHRPLPAVFDEERPDIFARATAWERRLDITFAHLLLGRRDLSNAFSLTGTRHPVPRIRRRRTPDQAQIARYFVDDLDHFERAIRKHGIRHLVNPGYQMFFLARAMGVGTSMLAVGRHESFYYWADSHLCQNSGVEPVYRALGNVDTGKRKERSYSNDYIPRMQFFAQRSVFSLLPKLFSEAKNAVIRKLTGSMAGYTFASMAAYRWRELMAKREMDRPPYVSLSELGDGRYMFFPLTTDPEWTLQVQSSSYFSQLWALAETARDLPAGVTLLVKEHIYGVGRRPRDLYEQILRFPNVKMLKLRENALDIVSRCDAVVSINGTTGYEAAMMGKPSIFLAEHCDCAFLPHVLHCPKGEGLRQALRTALDFPLDEAERIAAGSRFIAAIEQSCFSLADYSYLDRDNIDAQGVRQATDALLRQMNDNKPGIDAATDAPRQRQPHAS